MSSVVKPAWLNAETWDFLTMLRVHNEFWFMFLEGCGKKNPKAARKCLQDLQKMLEDNRFQLTADNVFQVCKACNGNIMGLIWSHYGNDIWELSRSLRAHRINMNPERYSSRVMEIFR